MSLKNNYYISSFFWSTLQKVLVAVLGFISVPLLLGYYGKADYGLLSIATACNGYMHLLDLGMNTGAVRFYSQWKATGEMTRVFRVARSNITFYIVIAVINILMLLALALFGEPLFSVTHEQFRQLQMCLFVLAVFSLFSWVTTVFNQLLIADKQMTFTMQVQCVITILKAALIGIIFIADLTLTTYFFFLTLLVSVAYIPYALRCKHCGLIDSFRPAWYWKDFKTVMLFSLSIFALGIFQTTATQSRPILLSIFAADGAGTVAEFRIIEVVPQLIIMIGGTFSGIFLPKTSEMVARHQEAEMKAFAYKWTTYTTVVVCILCFPFILSAKEVLTAYVGAEYASLSPWLIVWIVTVLIQMHTTPANALVLAHGKTKLLVRMTSVSCVVSMIINIFLCKYFGVGSAIIAYFIYVVIIMGLYYLYFYKKLLRLSRRMMVRRFIIPVILAVICYYIAYFLNTNVLDFGALNTRTGNILVCVEKTFVWLLPFTILLLLFKVINVKELRK